MCSLFVNRPVRTRMPHAYLSRLDIFQPDSATCPEAGASLCNPLKKPRIAFQSVLEPIILRPEANQQPRRLSVSRNHDFRFLGLSQIARKIVLYRCKRHFLNG